jgi:peptide-methionine (R)-S-oxide reductase
MTTPVQKSDAEWKALLAEKGAEPGAFQVTRHAATERPFSGKFERVWADGSYHCICCGNKLFDSGTKFDAGCGWPSFSKKPCPAPSRKIRDPATAWCAPRTCAPSAAPTWATCSPTAPPTPACATA